MTNASEPRRLVELAREGGDGLATATFDAAVRDLPSAERLAAIWARLPGPSGPDGDGPDDSGPDGGGADGGLDGGGGGADAGVDPSGLAAEPIAAGLKTAAVGGAKTGVVGSSVAMSTKLVVAVIGVAAAIGGGALMVASDAEPIAAPAPTADVSSAPTPIVSATLTPTAAQAETAPTASTAVSVPPPPATAMTPPPAVGPSEIELLQQAQAALGANPQRTLDLTSKAAAQYPSGALGQERTMLRIQALVGVGRRDQALAEARAFRDAHPSSPHVRRLETLFPDL